MSTTRNDRQAVGRAMSAIISESKRSSLKAAQSLQSQLPGIDGNARSRGQSNGSAELPDRIAELVYAMSTRRRLDELVLHPQVVEQIEELIEEFSNSALLRAHSLEPRHTLLLVGPPGNGKTSLAEAMATELGLPLLALRYDAIVDSFLGETSNRLRKLIEYATATPCVLFFDEFDAVGKERSDAQETGEIKRVVSSLLVQMDQLPSHSMVICATNHPELLDRAVWRRFELRLEIGRPQRDQLISWFKRFEAALGESSGLTGKEFADYLDGENMSAVEAFTLDVRRKIVLSRGKLTAAEAVRHIMKRSILPVTVNSREIDVASRVSNRPPRKTKASRPTDS